VSLMKRGNVYWSYLNMDGIRYSRSTGTSNLRQATQIELRFREQLNLKRLQIIEPHPEMPFGALAARFLAEGTHRPWHVDRLKLLLPYWSDVPIGRITKSMAVDYRRRRHAEKTVTDTTINRDLQALRHILFWAVDEGLLQANPLGRLRLVQERHKPRSILGLEDEERLLVASAPRLRQLIVAALDTGMRRGELFHQLWEHVDFNRKLLSVTQSKTAGGEGREIPFTNRVHEFLLAARKEEGLLFTFNGKPIRTIKTAWKAAVRRAGIRYLRFHDLRHTFNTRLMESGVIQDVRKVLMGHSVGEDINSTYTHVELPAKREAIRKLEEWVTTQTQHQPQAQGGADERTESRRTNSSKVLSFRTRKEAVEKEDSGRGRA
jgi:integrase